MIAVVELRDTSMDDRLFFHGRIKDDYGFTKLEFKVVKTNQSDTSLKEIVSFPVALGKESVQEFNYSFNLNEFVLNPGDRITYYFEVWDNDGIHGPKSATSQHFELQVPTEKELDNILSQNSNEAQEQAQKSMSELKRMQEDINELMRKLVDKKEFDWQDKKDLQELAKKQQQVKEMLQQMQQQLNENKKLEQKYKDQSEKLMEKQRELDKLMNEVMNDEMKQMMQEIEKMMKELDKDKVQEQLEQLKLDNQELEKQLVLKWRNGLKMPFRKPSSSPTSNVSFLSVPKKPNPRTRRRRCLRNSKICPISSTISVRNSTKSRRTIRILIKTWISS